MAMCEKCWADAYLRAQSDPAKSRVDHYADLLYERRDNPCTIAAEKPPRRYFPGSDWP